MSNKKNAAGPKNTAAGNKPLESGIQYRVIKQGRFQRKVVEKKVGKFCHSCNTYHGNEKTKLVIEPADPRFCKFIWKLPPPPVIISSKNRARVANGKRNGVRKSRKRNQDGAIRQPNDWVMYRTVNFTARCQECTEPLYVLARKIGNRPNRVVLFDDLDSRSVLYALWFLRKEVVRVCGITIPADVVHIIMFHAFSREVIDNEQLRRDQFHAPCGCNYHLSCFNRLTKSKSVCRQHNKAFP